MTAADLAERLHAKRNGAGWIAGCPAHEDDTPSLSITEGRDGRILLYDHGGCSTATILETLHLTERDLFSENGHGASAKLGEEVAAYDYRDEDGTLLYQVVRYIPKGFRQRRPDGRGGWIWKLGDVHRVLYRLPELLHRSEDAPVWIVEGEKDADVLAGHGLAATTNAGGAGKWKSENTATLKDADVLIVPDTDAPGLAHGEEVARHLRGTAARVRMLTLPQGKDVADFLSSGGTVADLTALAAAALDWTPAAPAEATERTPADTPTARPIIVIRPALTAMTDEAIAAIASCPALGVYVRARMLVTIARDGSPREHWVRRQPGAPVIVPVEHAQMMGMLDRAAQWVKADKRREGGQAPAMPPALIATQLLARTEWPFNYLEAVIETPTIRADGTILDQPGYDDATGVMFEPEPGTGASPPIPEHPTPQDVHAAVETLLAPVVDFPFVSSTDRAAYVAATFTLIARHVIDGPVPMFPVRAPTPGTGKGLLAQVIGLIGTGRAPAVMSMVEPDELRKRITALAVAGTPLVLLDDVSGSLGSDVLAAALTATWWEDRLLGQTQMVRLPLRIVWLATGNNLGFQRTLGRRVVPIDLDAKIEHPEDRTAFQHPDLTGFVRRTRPHLVTAALTILRGFVVAGRPAHGKAKLGSFERWDDLIRAAVIWAGLEDPAGADDPARGRGRIRAQADDDIEDLVLLHAELYRRFTGESWTAGDAWHAREHDEALRAALDAAAAPRRDRTKPATLVTFRLLLRSAVGRPVRGFVLCRASDPHERQQRWCITSIDQDERAP